MLKRVRKYIEENNILKEKESIVVGVSGGADSVALLLLLQELQEEYKLTLSVVHINHRIREEASEDADYVKELCRARGIAYYLFEADIPAMAMQQGKTEEEMGRCYRYQCFAKVMQRVGAKKLAVAHHRDDQVETILFHLIRGSSLSGMEGMRPIAPLPDGDLLESVTDGCVVRPLLPFRKNELVEWLKEKEITWREDVTNRNNVYSRNSLRNQVIPVLEDINVQAVEHIVRLGEEISSYQSFLKKIVDNYIREYVKFFADGSCGVDRQHLLQQDEVLINGVLYEVLTKVCGRKKDISRRHIEDIKNLMMNQSGKFIDLPYNIVAQNSYEKLVIRKNLQVEDEPFEFVFAPDCYEKMNFENESIRIDEQRSVRLDMYMQKDCSEKQWEDLVEEAISSKNNYTKYFECDTIKSALSIRSVKDEDSFVMNNKGERKKVSRYFIDEKIPIEQRGKTMVLAQGNNVLWIMGRRRSEDVKVTIQSGKILKVTCEGEW